MIIYRLKEAADKRKLTKTKLHYLSGVSYPTISRIWDGNDSKNKVKQIDMDVLDMLCRALDCKVCDLIEYVTTAQESHA